jgi:glucokinase
MAVIAINIESALVTYAIVGTSGKIIEREETPIGKFKGAEISVLVQKQIKKFLAVYANDPIQIKSVGIAVPGISYSKTGTVWAPNIPGWENYPLLQDISDLIKGKNIRVKIASNRTCCILGETWLGVAKGCKNAIYMSAGNGIGAGMLIDGRVLHGFNDAVGSIGWFAMDRPYKDEYKARGYFENRASGKGIIELTKGSIAKHENYAGFFRNKNLNELTYDLIIKAYNQKDPIVKKVMKEFTELWGMALANLISILNPEIIVFGGPLFGPANIFLEEIKNEANKWALPNNIQNVKFLGSKLGRDACLFGAGQLVLGKI